MGTINYPGALFGGMLGQYQGGTQVSDYLWNVGQTAGMTNTTNVQSYIVNALPVEAVQVKPKGPETALEWLDRRVNEVRLPLAA